MWQTLGRSGFWRWYLVSPCDETVAGDGARRVRLSVPSHSDRLELVVSVAPDDTIRSVSAWFSMSWIRGEAGTSASAVVCMASLLRSLEPDDTFVWELRGKLLSAVGLGPPRPADLDGPGESTLEAVCDTLLGESGGLRVSLEQGTLLRVSAGSAAVAIEWLAAPVNPTTPRFESSNGTRTRSDGRQWRQRPRSHRAASPGATRPP